MRGGEHLDDLDRHFATLPVTVNWHAGLTGDQLAELRRRFERAMAGPQRHRLLTPLPHRTRLRLRLASRRDRTAAWLCDHGRPGAAERLWRLTGAWRTR